MCMDTIWNKVDTAAGSELMSTGMCITAPSTDPSLTWHCFWLHQWFSFALVSSLRLWLLQRLTQVPHLALCFPMLCHVRSIQLLHGQQTHTWLHADTRMSYKHRWSRCYCVHCLPVYWNTLQSLMHLMGGFPDVCKGHPFVYNFLVFVFYGCYKKLCQTKRNASTPPRYTLFVLYPCHFSLLNKPEGEYETNF